jgi:dTDP-4-amino-4,6-dideoxygalactose transaminase
MRVPLLDVVRQNLPLEEELLGAFRRVLNSGQFILGAEVERFEAAAAAVAGARFGIGMSSGTDAILAALMALGIGPGDEVICPAFTFFATAGCIVRVGARPVFADSLPGCFNIDPAGIEPLITPRTKAIIPVHLFGQAADMEEIMDVALRHGLAVIEDAAQAFGAAYQGRPVGSFGHFAAVSFFPTKNLGALGDAGLLVCQDEALAGKARVLRNHGAERRYFHSTVGGNFRLDALQAALLDVKLKHLGEYTAKRQENACKYSIAFSSLPAPGKLRIIPPASRPGRTHIVNQYTLRVVAGSDWAGLESPRDALRRFLNERGIAAEIYYPVPLHHQQCFQEFGPFPALPVCEALSREALSLPVFPELTAEERAAVIQAVGDFMDDAAR